MKLTVVEPKEISESADLSGFIAAWHESLELRRDSNELSGSTDTAYKIGFEKFTDWMQAHNVNGVDPDIIRTYKADLLKQGYKPGTVNTWLAAVRSFFSWAVERRLTAYNPTNGIKGAARNGSTKRHKREPLTNSEVRRILAIPDPGTDTGRRDLAILKIFLFTGIRTVELHRADLEDLRTENNQLVLFIQGKGHGEADDFVILPETAADAVYDWLAVRGKKPGALFTSLSNRSLRERLSLRAIRHIVKDIYSKAGITGNQKTTHSLRHTAATAAIRGGAPVQKVQSMLRHKSIDTTLIYIHELDRYTDPAEGYISYETNGNNHTEI